MGRFAVKLTEKYTQYGNDYLVEDPKANLLIITGMGEYSSRYERFAKDLNAENYSVSILDHWGQGENVSDLKDLQKWPINAWNMTLKALNLKVKELRKQNKPVYLMGHSMGSFAVQNYLFFYPGSVDKVIIMGSNGKNNKFTIAIGNMISKMITKKSNWDNPCKLMHNLSLGAYSKSVKDRKTENDWISYNEENVIAYNNDPYCGAMNTYGFFHEFMKGMNTLYKKENLNKISKKQPILIVSGEDDPVGANSKGPKSLEKMYKSLGVNDVNLILYPQMRHEILNEVDYKKPTSDIIEFLNK